MLIIIIVIVIIINKLWYVNIVIFCSMQVVFCSILQITTLTLSEHFIYAH